VNIIVRFAVISAPAYPQAGLKWKAGLSHECRHEHAGEHQNGAIVCANATGGNRP
jgi:hypothetical protein